MRRWNRRVKPGTRSTALLESTTIGWHFILTEWMKSYPPCEFLIFSSRAERLTLGYCCCFRSALDAFTHTNRQQAQNMLLSMAIHCKFRFGHFLVKRGEANGSLDHIQEGRDLIRAAPQERFELRGVPPYVDNFMGDMTL